MEKNTKTLVNGLRNAAAEAGVSVCINQVGSMLTVFFTEKKVVDFATAVESDTKRYAAFFRANLENGIMLAPSQFEAAFVSTMHTDSDINRTIELAKNAFNEASF